MGEIMKSVNNPSDLKKFEISELRVLAGELREKIINVTSEKGGHLAASLGAVDLAVALHYCLDTPADSLVWDVGHQSYAHKLLTGRRDIFATLRETGGMSGFPNRRESEYDIFTCGHSATSISSALGLAAARDIKGEKNRVYCVIGDASLSTGLAFEGLNHAGHMGTDMTVVLNDNEHSISRSVGAMSRYLNTVITNPIYNKVRQETENVIKNIPKLGPVTIKTVRKMQENMKSLLVPGILFEELGLRYFGPIDGHDMRQMINLFTNIRDLKGPIIAHVITKKGKGYPFAEEDPTKFHGVSTFDVKKGTLPTRKKKTFTDHFSDKICGLAAQDETITAITAAMPDGTGLKDFSRQYPERFFDVGITEPHAVTFSAGLARKGMKPVVAVYSTFLQRSYDQLIHDVALQELPVVICADRSGLVGRDGPTHHGVFDIAYSRTLPGFIVMAPKDGIELEEMLEKALEWDKPVFIRYPRSEAARIVSSDSCDPVETGKSETLRDGDDLILLALGSMVNTALKAADLLSGRGIEAEVINARFVKPLDREMLENIAHSGKRILILEEGIASGGFGSAVLEFFAREGLLRKDIQCFSLPDEFIQHGAREELLRMFHLTPDELAANIEGGLKG